jgi:hypothetical protein
MSNNNFKCPICHREYLNKGSLYNHIETEHPEQVQDVSPSQLYFNYKNRYPLHNGNGKCIIDRKPTPWNNDTERYERLCSDGCREKYREMFKDRMKKRYGKEHLLDDPEQQKKMLASREISGEYEWSNGIHKTTYTGSYEKDFLEFMDLVLQWENPEDVMMPAPQIFEYKGQDGKSHFYIPDVYITSLNLIIEIKSDENKHYRARDINIEKTKDDILGKSGYEYLKIYDKKYGEFFNWLLNRKQNDPM